MKICAIICELNPPHKGHEYLFKKARELSGCDYIMAILSGDFVQRGEPAILSAKKRAELSLSIGADIVVAIPTLFSTACAEYFAKAGVMIANSFKNVTHLAFGIDFDNPALYIEEMSKLALESNNQNFDEHIKNELKIMPSYAKSKTKVLGDIAKQLNLKIKVIDVLNEANNMLGFEYMRAMQKLNSSIIPLPIIRQKKFEKATNLRLWIQTDFNSVAEFVNDKTLTKLKENICDYKKFKECVLFNYSKKSLADIRILREVNEEIANKIYNLCPNCKNIDDLNMKTKTKFITHSRLTRINVACLLDMIKCDELSLNELPYIKVLAVKNRIVLKYLKCKFPLILRKIDADSVFDCKMAKLDDKAHRIYCSMNGEQYTSWLFNKLIILN